MIRAGLAVAALACAGAAADDTADADAEPSAGAAASIVGVWAFRADTQHWSCRFEGEASIRPGPDPNTYLCDLMATDSCLNRWWHQARQSCVASRDGDRLTITSTIVEITPPTDNYLPDDFELTIVDGTLMVGELRSAMLSDAEFFRRDEPIG